MTTTARRVLAIDTATDSVITGVVELSGTALDGPGPMITSGAVRVLAERAVTDHRRHAELLTTLIAECLAEADTARAELAAVVVGCGPGPFTGLRVGMATGAAFADALGLPAYGVCSLDALALEAVATADPPAGDALVVTDARRREVYWARYRAGERLRGPEVAAPAAVADELAGDPAGFPTIVAGSAAHLELVGWSGPPPAVTVPTPRGLVAAAAADVLAGSQAQPLVPLYLRRPDAVEQKAKRAEVAR